MSGIGCRVSGVSGGGLWHCSVTVLTLFWPGSGLSLHCPWPAPALAWPVTTSVYALAAPGSVRVFQYHPVPTHPGYTIPGTPPSYWCTRGAWHAAVGQSRPLGSLLAALQETCTGLVTCPCNTGHITPLIDTLCHHPVSPVMALYGPTRPIVPCPYKHNGLMAKQVIRQPVRGLFSAC